MSLKKIVTGFLVSLICLSTNCFGEFTESQPQYPEIEFKYNWKSYVMDLVGSFCYGTPITDDLKKQLDEQLPKLISAWEREAPIVFEKVFSYFKQGIKAKKRKAIINLSHGNSYGSHRILLFGLRWIVNPESWNCSISREDAFSVLVFHELLHVWVDENINKDISSLLKKYCDEDFDVLDHLHLMAIQKLVYLQINRLDLLDYISESYELHQGPIYKRAWDIVNYIEEYETVLQDIVIKD